MAALKDEIYDGELLPRKTNKPPMTDAELSDMFDPAPTAKCNTVYLRLTDIFKYQKDYPNPVTRIFISEISKDQFCKLSESIIDKVDDHIDKLIDLNINIEKWFSNQETLKKIQQIHDIIHRSLGGTKRLKRTRRKKQKRRTKKLKRRS